MGGPEAKRHQFVVPAGESSRLDIWLAARLDYSRSQIKKLVDQGLVTVNGERVKAGYLIRPGDRLHLVNPKQQSPSLVPQAIPLEIVYEDDLLAVVNKPKNLVVHPGAGNWEGTLVNALLFHFPKLAPGFDESRPGIVHRLDKDTSGLMLVAKDDVSFRYLAHQFKRQAVKRHYLALVQGVIQKQGGVIDKPLGRHPRVRTKMAVLRSGRQAQTSFSVMERFKRHTLVLCRLQTGRTHQIRVHFASIHHPLVGDPLYGFKTHNLGAESQTLHAVYLGLVHPNKGFMEFSSQPPPEFEKIVQKARLMN